MITKRKSAGLKGVLFLLALLQSFGAMGQKNPFIPLNQYVHKIYTSEDGLPQNSGRAIVQTHDGLIWIGTMDGLVCFDGSRFCVFDKNNTPEIMHDDITSLIVGRDSTLWIGTYNGVTSLKNGIFRYHPANVSIEPDVVRSLAEDHDGKLWIGTMNSGLYKYWGGKYEFIATAKGLTSNTINALTVDRENNLWIGTNAGLNVNRNGRWSYYHRQNGLPNDRVRSIRAARDGTIWIGTDGGLVKWKKGSIRIYTTADGLSDISITAIYEDKSGALWIGTERGGVCQYVNNKFIPFRSSDGLSGDYVSAIFEDVEGSLWVGMYIAGINQFWKGKFLNFTTKDGLPNRIFHTMVAARDGNIWISTEGAGVLRFDGKKFKTYTTKDGLPNDFIQTVFQDSHNNLWIGTREGLAHYKDGRFHTYTKKDGLSQNFVRVIGEDHEGHLWVGTYSGGIHRYENGRFVNYCDKGLSIKAIRTILVDHSGAVWIGSNEAVTCWKNGRVITYTAKDGLPVEPIYDIVQDGEHTLWMGSYGGGLVRLKDNKITRYTYKDGLTNEVVFKILEDDLGNLWLSSMRGISTVSKQMLNDFADGKIGRIQCTTYNVSDGMIISECTGAGGCKAPDGSLWFTTPKGIVVVDPNNIRKSNLPPQIAIERVIVNGIEKLMSSEKIIASPGSGNAEFHFTAATYIAHEKVLFSYILEGFDAEWKKNINQHSAYYTNLPPGEYVFRVTGCNSDGVWNEAGLSIPFEIQPFFYQTKWFLVLIGFFVLGTGFGVYRWRVWHLLKREQELSRRVDEALAKIKVLHGLIPICSHCKKIRDDKGYWNQLEQYFNEHSDATFSHGICPDCAKKVYGDLLSRSKGKQDNT